VAPRTLSLEEVWGSTAHIVAEKKGEESREMGGKGVRKREVKEKILTVEVGSLAVFLLWIKASSGMCIGSC